MVRLGPFGEGAGIEPLHDLPAAHLQFQHDGPLAQALSVKFQHLLIPLDPQGAAVEGMSFRQSYAALDAWAVRAFKALGVPASYREINDIISPRG